MKLFALALLATVFYPPLLADDVAPHVVADPFPPAKITSLYIEKDENGSSIVIQLSGDAVTYKSTLNGKLVENVTVTPAPDDWFNFIQGLNAAKVYKWAPKYDYPAQGISWAVDLSMEDRQLISTGTNDYPKEGAEDQPAADPSGKPSVPFQVFWQAALKLVGKGAPPAPPK